MTEDKKGSTEKQNVKTWKNPLLKSSLPLEQVVSEKLAQRGFSVSGEFSYIRQNEQNVETEFSVDLYAFREFKKNTQKNNVKFWGKENILVECKYSYPDVVWVFSQYPEYINTNFVNCLELPCRPLLKDTSLYELDQRFHHSIRGVGLKDGSFDPNAISHGLHQLRYAYPNLVKQEIERIEDPTRKEPTPAISYMYMILVTNAPLYILKTQQALEKYNSAESLDDIAQKVDALVVSQETGPALIRYQKTILSYELERVLNPSPYAYEDVDPLLGPYEGLNPEDVCDLLNFITNTLARSAILVVNINSLEATLNMIAHAIYRAETGKSAVPLPPDTSTVQHIDGDRQPQVDP